MIYPLVLDLAADGIPVAVTCRVLGFSKQAFYQWKAQPISQRDWDDAHLINVAMDIHHDDPAFGYRFIADELARARHHRRREPGRPALLPAADLVGVRQETRPDTARPVRRSTTTCVRRRFTAPAPNRLWLTDITEHHTAEGKLYLCAIKDLWSNRIVGYSIDSRMKATSGRDRSANAVAVRQPAAGTIVHSDRGSQFRSRKFVQNVTAQRFGRIDGPGRCLR